MDSIWFCIGLYWGIVASIWFHVEYLLISTYIYCIILYPSFFHLFPNYSNVTQLRWLHIAHPCHSCCNSVMERVGRHLAAWARQFNSGNRMAGRLLGCRTFDFLKRMVCHRNFATNHNVLSTNFNQPQSSVCNFPGICGCCIGMRWCRTIF